MTESLLSPSRARELSGGLSESTLRRLVARGEYPQPVVLSRTRTGRPARIAWPESEVRAWAVARIATARGESAEART
jgi:predicted DNA-binding transcriptional regulator AlpA